MVFAILLCAGKSERFGDNKLLFPLSGKPLFTKPLETLLANKNIDHVIVVIPNDSKFIKIVKKYKEVKYCFGSTISRTKSLLNAIQFIKSNYPTKPNDIIVSHDGARIFVTNQLIDDLIAGVKKNQIATVGCLCQDAIYDTDHCQFINRNNIVIIQTPQGCLLNYFENKKIVDGYDLFASLNIRLLPKHIVTGCRSNIKITTKSDLIRS